MAGSPGNKYYNIFMDYAIWLKFIDNKEILNEDCFILLHEIQKLGSIKQASQKINISYRKAWNIISESEKMLGFKLVEKQRGGKDGGRSVLSAEGENLVNAFNDLKTDINLSIKKVTKKFFHKLNQEEK